jgi:hypothetical protein
VAKITARFFSLWLKAHIIGAEWPIKGLSSIEGSYGIKNATRPIQIKQGRKREQTDKVEP